jgi:RND family efflux transporter MFP subunit
MNTVRRFFLPLLVVLVAGGVGVLLLNSGPEPKRKPQKPINLTVETISVKPESFTIIIPSQGLMAPYLRSALTSEVAGRLVEVSPSFIRGAFFAKGELLASIDPESYRLQAINLEASIKVVKSRLEELETSRINLKKSLTIEAQLLNLAERGFKRLSVLKKSGTVTESSLEQGERELLSRRLAQLNLKNALDLIPAQRHNLEAEQQLKQAQKDSALLDLERTRIFAPFTGRVMEKQANLGQFVNKGQTVGEIFATDKWEVRLPVSSQDLALLDLSNLEQGNGSASHGPPVKLIASGEEGSVRREWSGHIIRMESAVDSHTRQVILVARINSSDKLAKPDSALLDGSFVEASIQGRTLDGVFILPRHTAGPGDRILIITPENRLERRVVDIVWRDSKSVVVMRGLKAGERISLTPLPYAPNGALVTVAQAEGQEKKSYKRRKGKGGQ